MKNVLKKSQFWKMEYVILVHKEHIIKIKYVLNVVICNIGIIHLKHVNLVKITYSIINLVISVRDALLRSQFWKVTYVMLVQRELIIIIYNKYASHVAIYNFSIIPHKNVINAKIFYFITNLLENVKNVQLINHIYSREYVILAHKIVIIMV